MMHVAQIYIYIYIYISMYVAANSFWFHMYACSYICVPTVHVDGHKYNISHMYVYN